MEQTNKLTIELRDIASQKVLATFTVYRPGFEPI